MKFTFVLFFLSLISFKIFPQSQPTTPGCYIQCSGCVNAFYVTKTTETRGSGATLGNVYVESLALRNSTSCPRVAGFTNQSSYAPCYGPSPSYQSGIVYNNYTINYCPIDSELIYLILISGVLSFILLRRNLIYKLD